MIFRPFEPGWWSVGSAICALIAAGFWFWSARVPITFGFLQDIERAADMEASARLSAVAAIFAGVSAILSAAGMFLNPR
jgi:uncharacterized iron-regulated membrane protein